MRGRTVLLVAAVPAVLVAALAIGAVPVAPGEVWRALRDPGAPAAAIVRDVRAPRVLLAFLVGGSLSVAGAGLQALVRNPLADPYLLGLAGGASVGAVLAIAAGLPSPWLVPAAAFAGALAAVALVYRLALVAGHRLDPRVLLLGGVVVGAFAGAITSAVTALSSAERLRDASLWLLGGFGGASWRALGVVGAYAVAPLVVLASQARALDLLVLGDEPALHLGADVARTRRLVYLAASLLVAACVAVAGVVGFVGLVAPHVVRRVWTPLHGRALPLAFLLGGAFLVLADLVARSVVRPLELPVGVVTALVGVPLFLVLLRRQVA